MRTLVQTKKNQLESSPLACVYHKRPSMLLFMFICSQLIVHFWVYWKNDVDKFLCVTIYIAAYLSVSEVKGKIERAR